MAATQRKERHGILRWAAMWALMLALTVWGVHASAWRATAQEQVTLTPTAGESAISEATTPTLTEEGTSAPGATLTLTDTPAATPTSTATLTVTPLPSLTPTTMEDEVSGTPSATPSATPVEVGPDPLTETPRAESTVACLPATLSPATCTPVATCTLRPTATPYSGCGTTQLAPNNAASAGPGTTVTYRHTVTNDFWLSDIKKILARSSQGWRVELYEADGVTPLTDHTGDGVPDTGKLRPLASVVIVVKVFVPQEAALGTVDVTKVVAYSSCCPVPINQACVTDTTTVAQAISIVLSTHSTEFGRIGPDGTVDPDVTYVTSAQDAAGAFYYKSGMVGAVQVTVFSSSPWTGATWAQENTGSAGIYIRDGALAWQLAATTAWVPFVTQVQSPPYDNNCFAERQVGTNLYRFDYRLRVNWSDAPGSFQSLVTYAVSQ